MSRDDEIKTQNGPVYPNLDLVDGGIRTILGGGGDEGHGKLGIPWATSAIGSGPEVTAKDTNPVRRGMSIEGNRVRMPDRDDDRLQARR